MICYLDRAFCTQSNICKRKDCSRNFNAYRRKAACEWWGSDDAPVAFCDFSECEEWEDEVQ
jgi:hypothetical protein